MLKGEQIYTIAQRDKLWAAAWLTKFGITFLFFHLNNKDSSSNELAFEHLL